MASNVLAPGFRNPYDEQANLRERLATDLHTGSETEVQQHHKKDADINEIVRRMKLDGIKIQPVMDPRAYGVVNAVADLGEALRITKQAQEMFLALPASIRNKFENDGRKLDNWLRDERNWPEAVELGLLSQDAPASTGEPLKVIVVPGGDGA